jgi:iron complex outermembrane receptor protein
VPRVRANLIATYRPDDKWTASVAARHSGRKYATLENSDISPNTFGGVSSYTVWAVKATYRITRLLAASYGMNNLMGRQYYVYHPYPGRTFVGELHASF